MTVVEDVKDRIDIVEVIGETVKLRKSGKNYTGFCPFHPNTRTPAFAIFPDNGTWRCFGACNEGGDIFSFLMKKEGWDFTETLRHLAERAGVELRPYTPEQEAADEANQRLRDLLESAVMSYRHNLNKTSAGEPALAYLRERGLDDTILEAFGIGLAIDSWDSALEYLQGKGYSREEMIAAGMVTERDDGGIFDRFRNRIMIPIRDAKGGMAGFGARVLDPGDSPKYLNSPQSVLFDKGGLLYGLDKARKAIRSADQAVIVEGYMDVISLHKFGFQNVVSSMGTAITERQLRTLKRYSRRMILALDADVAGSQATLRGLEVAREALERQADPVFNSRGLVRNEGRLDADIRIVTLPEGLDPDEVVSSDPEAWPKLLDGAQTVVDFVMGVLARERDLDDPKEKASVARRILPLIEDVADPVERETYRQRLARQLKVDERALQSWRPGRGSRRTRRRAELPKIPEERQVAVSTSAIESFCLGVLLLNPELLYKIDREFQALSLERTSAQDFTSAEGQVIFQAVRSALTQDDEEPVRYWRLILESPIDQLADEYLAEVVDLDIGLPRVIEEIIANFLRLRKRNLETALNHLRFRLQEAQELPDNNETQKEGDVWHHTREVQRIASHKERLDRALERPGGSISSTSGPAIDSE